MKEYLTPYASHNWTATAYATTTFTYDGDGKLVKKTVGITTTYYVNAGYEKTGSVVTKYYYAGSQRVAMRVCTGTNGSCGPNGATSTLSYLHGDHLGSASLATNASGVKIANSDTRYYPYGEARPGLEGTGLPTDRRFTGQRREIGLGLYDYNARYYDPYLNRFISPDTIIPDPANPQSLNRYAYNYNNPLRYIDPTGHEPQPPESEGSSDSNLRPDAYGFRFEGTVALFSILGDLTGLASIAEPTPFTEPLAALLWLLSKAAVDVNIDFVYIPKASDLTDLLNMFVTISGGGLTEGGSVSGGPLFFWGLEESSQLTGPNLEIGATAVAGCGGVELALGYSPPMEENEKGVTSLYVSPGLNAGAEVSGYVQVGYGWNITKPLFGLFERWSQHFRKEEK